MTDDVTDATRSEQRDDGGPRVNRRRLLRTGLNVGVSGALVWGLGADYVSSDDLGAITYATARPEPGATTLEARTKEVPVPWHESLRVAFKAQETIRSAGLSALVGSFIVPGSYDEPEASIAVDATDKSISEQLKEQVDDVIFDVSVLDELPPKPKSTSEFSDAYQLSEMNRESIPGGVVCQTEAGYGTLTPALYDESGSRYFATSNHVYGETGTKKTEHQGEPLSVVHDDKSYHVGDVVRGYPTADVVQVEPVDGFQPASRIERASPSQVIGQFTQMGLADLMAQGESLTKTGALSDRTTGAIEGVNGVTCYTGEACKSGQLKWGGEQVLQDGDSGSVNYHVDPENPDEYLLVGGINNARTWWPGSDFAWGTAAHHLFDRYGLHF